MLGVHLDCCPRASAPGRSCGRLHNSRSAGNCCTWSQMLLCTCGLISRGSLPPLPPTPPSTTTYSFFLPPSFPCWLGTVQGARYFGGNQTSLPVRKIPGGVADRRLGNAMTRHRCSCNEDLGCSGPTKGPAKAMTSVPGQLDLWVRPWKTWRIPSRRCGTWKSRSQWNLLESCSLLWLLEHRILGK